MYSNTYQIATPIPKHIFNNGYPLEIHCLGDLIRKTRMDNDLEVKHLGRLLAVGENTVINWEIRGIYPKGVHLKRVITFIENHSVELTSKEKLWGFCFANNRFYPKTTESFGEQLRTVRMQNFISIRQLAKELNVNASTIRNWETGKSKPSPDLKERVLKYFNSLFLKQESCHRLSSAPF